MRRLLVLAAVVVLVVPAAAPAKGMRGALRICGASECRILDRHTGHDPWTLLGDLTGGSAAGPAPPGPFYELAILPLDERGRPQPDFPYATFYYAPRSRRVRTTTVIGVDNGVWRSLEPPPSAVASAVRRLRPLPAPVIVRVEVNGRVARGPHSYLRLYRLPATRRPIGDPAGEYPSNSERSGDVSEVVRYWERIERHWLPVNLWSRRPGPWGDVASLWVARRLPLVKRDGEIVRVPEALAARIRAARSLR